MNRLMAIKVDGRNIIAPHLQEILTRYGCIITTRVGFHETDKTDQCSRHGVIILQLSGEGGEINSLYNEVKDLDGVSAKFIEF